MLKVVFPIVVSPGHAGQVASVGQDTTGAVVVVSVAGVVRPWKLIGNFNKGLSSADAPPPWIFTSLLQVSRESGLGLG